MAATDIVSLHLQGIAVRCFVFRAFHEQTRNPSSHRPPTSPSLTNKETLGFHKQIAVQSEMTDQIHSWPFAKYMYHTNRTRIPNRKIGQSHFKASVHCYLTGEFLFVPVPFFKALRYA